MGSLPSVRGDMGRRFGCSHRYAIAVFDKFPHLRRPADALVLVLNVLSGVVGAVQLHARRRGLDVRRLWRDQAPGSLNINHQRLLRGEYRHALRRLDHDAHSIRKSRGVLILLPFELGLRLETLLRGTLCI
jgi:hypothetical protein